jgi:hypothetical protein
MASTEIHDGSLDGVEAMQLDEPGSGNTPGPPTLQLSGKESQILELYDRLEELKLDISFLQAQESVPNGMSLSPTFLPIQRILSLRRSIRNCLRKGPSRCFRKVTGGKGSLCFTEYHS